MDRCLMRGGANALSARNVQERRAWGRGVSECGAPGNPWEGARSFLRKETTLVKVSRREVLCALIAAIGIGLAGCESTGGLTDEAKGAGIGALAGCAIGAAISGNVRGCAIGAAAGAAVGFAAVKITQYQARQVRSASADRRLYGFTRATDSAQVKIRRVRSSPKHARPGQSVRFATDYSLLVPRGRNDVPVDESWVLKKGGRRVWVSPTKKVERVSGGWDSDITIALPTNMPVGDYVVVHKVRAGNSYDESESTLIVRG